MSNSAWSHTYNAVQTINGGYDKVENARIKPNKCVPITFFKKYKNEEEVTIVNKDIVC